MLYTVQDKMFFKAMKQTVLNSNTITQFNIKYSPEYKLQIKQEQHSKILGICDK